MNQMEIFKNPEFGAIRAVEIDGEPWLVGKDVSLALGYTNPQKAIRDHVDAEDRTVNDSFTVNGTAITLINESGLYSLVLSSKLPKAKQFRRWVTSEVLPTIRKHGAYMTREKLWEVATSPEALLSRTPWLWQLEEQHIGPVSAMLERSYGVAGDDLAQQLTDVAGKLASEYWDDHQRDFRYIVDGSFLAEYDDYNIEVQFKSAATVSIAYALMSRCGLDTEQYFQHEDFMPIFDFNRNARCC